MAQNRSHFWHLGVSGLEKLRLYCKRHFLAQITDVDFNEILNCGARYLKNALLGVEFLTLSFVLAEL